MMGSMNLHSWYLIKLMRGKAWPTLTIKIKRVVLSPGESLKSELCSGLLTSLQSLDETHTCESHSCMFACKGRQY